MPGMILIEATFGLSFCILLFRAFVSTIPRELDEAAIIDGAGPMRLFFAVDAARCCGPSIDHGHRRAGGRRVQRLRGPALLPARRRRTPPCSSTLYNFQSQSVSQWNLLFMDILLITIPPLIMYIFFNRQIVAGMTSGAVKG